MSNSLYNTTINPKLLPALICLEADLFFSTRLVDVIRAQGGQPIVVETPEAFVQAMNLHAAVLALVDLATEGDWAQAIAQCKTQPETKQTPIYAFGSHVDTETLRLARKAGADHAWARSKLMEELVGLVARHINPPMETPAGWQDSPSEAALHGIEAFNAGDYFEQHEYFEEAWKLEPRPIREVYQGILQIGLAFLQIERGNWSGAVKMFRRGLPRLRSLPPVCQGIEIGKLSAAANAIHAQLLQLGSARLAEFDRSQFPKIEFANVD